MQHLNWHLVSIQLGLMALGYLLGSIPFGLLLTRIAGLGDIRKVGSGNIGATNVLRTGNKLLAATVLLLDGIKGAVAVLVAQYLAPDIAPIVALLALFGHVYPAWLNFKGGKGVATAIGVLLALAWPVGVAVIVAWLAIAFLTRYSSLAALLSIGLTPVFALCFGYPDILWLMVTIVVLIASTHAANIERLRLGTEPKIGKSKDAKSSVE